MVAFGIGHRGPAVPKDQQAILLVTYRAFGLLCVSVVNNTPGVDYLLF
jgi:hypothetical protein